MAEKNFLAYVGWTLNGSFAIVGYTQGINILLNLFFGPCSQLPHELLLSK